jgi:uncharacterized metal-binding protein
MNVLVLHCCGQVFEKINSKEEILILAHGFQGYSPCSVCSVVSKPVVRQDAMAEGHVEHSCSPQGSWEAERDRGLGQVIAQGCL